MLSVDGRFHRLDSELRGWGQRDFPHYHHTVSAEPVEPPADEALLAAPGRAARRPVPAEASPRSRTAPDRERHAALRTSPPCPAPRSLRTRLRPRPRRRDRAPARGWATPASTCAPSPRSAATAPLDTRDAQRAPRPHPRGRHRRAARRRRRRAARRRRARHGARGSTARAGSTAPSCPSRRSPSIPAPRAELIADDRRRRAAPLTLIATGPLTNVAIALEASPGARGPLREIVWMGGSTERGNVTPPPSSTRGSIPRRSTACSPPASPSRWSASTSPTRRSPRPRSWSGSRRVGGAVGDAVAGLVRLLQPLLRRRARLRGAARPRPVRRRARRRAGRHAPARTRTWPSSSTGAGRAARPSSTSAARARPNARVALELDVERFWDLVVDGVSSVGR